jgi:hypothetical protein
MQSTSVAACHAPYGVYLMKQFALWNFINLIFTLARKSAIEFFTVNRRTGLAFRGSCFSPADFFLREFILLKPFRNKAPSNITAVSSPYCAREKVHIFNVAAKFFQHKLSLSGRSAPDIAHEA